MSLRLRPSLTTWRSGSPLSPGSGGRYPWETAGPAGGYNGGYNRGYNGGPTGVLERNQTRLSVPIGFAVIQPDFLVHMNICWRTGLARQSLEEWPANGRTDHSHEDSRAHRVRSTPDGPVRGHGSH